VGERLAQETLAATLHMYLNMATEPAAALALVLEGCPPDIIARRCKVKASYTHSYGLIHS
jgi:hypothetical protein